MGFFSMIPHGELRFALNEIALGQRYRAVAQPATTAPSVARRHHVLGRHRTHEFVRFDVVIDVILLVVDQALYGGRRTQDETL